MSLKPLGRKVGRGRIPKPEYYEDVGGQEAVYDLDDDLEAERTYDSLLDELETWIDYLSPEDKQEYLDAVRAQQKRG